jgi:hypothetical protein
MAGCCPAAGVLTNPEGGAGHSSRGPHDRPPTVLDAQEKETAFMLDVLMLVITAVFIAGSFAFIRWLDRV